MITHVMFKLQLQQTTISIHFSGKTSLDISCAKQMIHMKCLDLFSLKNNENKNYECCLLQILFGTLKINASFAG